MRLSIIILAVLFLAAVAWAGNVYVWKDEDGVVRMGDAPPQRTPENMETISGGDVAAEGLESRIELYVTDWCPYCTLAIEHLESRKVKFEVYNIEKDSSARRRKMQLSDGRGGVPFAVIYGHPIIGFSPEKYDWALETGR